MVIWLNPVIPPITSLTALCVTSRWNKVCSALKWALCFLLVKIPTRNSLISLQCKSRRRMIQSQCLRRLDIQRGVCVYVCVCVCVYVCMCVCMYLYVCVCIQYLSVSLYSPHTYTHSLLLSRSRTHTHTHTHTHHTTHTHTHSTDQKQQTSAPLQATRPPNDQLEDASTPPQPTQPLPVMQQPVDIPQQ